MKTKKLFISRKISMNTSMNRTSFTRMRLALNASRLTSSNPSSTRVSYVSIPANVKSRKNASFVVPVRSCTTLLLGR